MEASHLISTGHSHLEDSWTCHRCGFVYPNPHPSAKHRRNHKKHCGKIKGFELHVHNSQLHAGGSSDEASTDEEGHSSKDYPANHPQEVLSGDRDFDVPYASSQSGPTAGETNVIREASGSQVLEKSTVAEQPKDLFKSKTTLSNDTSLDTEALPESLRIAAGVEHRTFSNPLQAQSVQKDGLAYEYSEKEKLDPLLQGVHLTEHTEASIPKEGHSQREDSWTCHNCGWVYPNPHPSAKHRRNHKKHCGKIKGFESKVPSDEPHAEGSSGEASSDEEEVSRKAEHVIDRVGEILSSEHYLDISSAGKLSGSTLSGMVAAREGSESGSPQNNMVTEQPDGLLTSDANLSDTGDLTDPLRNVPSSKQRTSPDALGVLDMQKKVQADDLAEAEKSLPSNDSLVQDMPITKHVETSMEKQGQPMGTVQESIITLESQALEIPTDSEKHTLERKDHDAASKQVSADEIAFDRINKEETLHKVGMNEVVSGLDGSTLVPQESITLISTALESDFRNIAEDKVALMESSGVDLSADDLYYQEDKKSYNDTLPIEQRMEDLVIVSQEETKAKLVAEDTRNQELSFVASVNLAKSSESNVTSVPKQDLVTGMHDTMGESEDSTKSMEHTTAVRSHVIDSSFVEAEIHDEKTKVHGNEKEISEQNLQAQSSVLQEGGLLSQNLFVPSQDDSRLQASAIPESLLADSSSGAAMQKEEKVKGQFYEVESDFQLDRNVKESNSDSTGVSQEPPRDKIMIASVSQASESLDDSEAFMDASESLETCSLGASVDENESVDGAAQNAVEVIDQSADTSDPKGSLKKQVEEGIFQVAASGDKVSISESRVPGHEVGQAGLDGMGVLTNIDEFHTPQTTPSQDYLNTQNTQMPYVEKLKAPSPEAWQDPGAFQEFSADKARSEVLPLESNITEQKGQTTETEKSHIPLRSLLDKEVKDMAESNHKEPKANAQENLNTIEGILGSPSSGRKTKTKSIWNHCICCPAVH